jgi:transcriptional regulator with AAA-type ATPase domain
VLITGESGTGKEVYARFVRDASARADKPFVAINCAAIPENMLEATLFGYEKGAFTGAAAAHAGKFEQAQGGTLLLDEISEMDLGLQAKILRVLQEREVERLGSTRTLSLDVRVIVSTSCRCVCRRCATGPATSCHWRGAPSRRAPAAARSCLSSPQRRSANSCNTTGRATLAS